MNAQNLRTRKNYVAPLHHKSTTVHRDVIDLTENIAPLHHTPFRGWCVVHIEVLQNVANSQNFTSKFLSRKNLRGGDGG